MARLRLLPATLALLGGLVVVHAVHAVTGVGGPAVDVLVEDWLFQTVEYGAAGLCLARAALHRPGRGAWSALGAGLLFWAGGDLTWTLWLNDLDEVPYPSVADALYLVSYPLQYVGLVLLLRAQLRPFSAAGWLDGLLGGLAVAALAATVVFPVMAAGTGDRAVAVAVNLAYPVFDLVLLGLVITAFGLCGWRPGPAWSLLGLGLAVNAAADCVFLVQEARGTYTPGGLLDSAWPLGLLLIGAAAWAPRRRPVVDTGWRTVAVPGAFALVAVGLLVVDEFVEVGPLAAVLASGAVLVAVVRGGLTFRENLRLVARSRLEAVTDGLTGLANRRALIEDLEQAAEAARDGRACSLAFFDLDGFKQYNDLFGHAAGDALLRCLGTRLELAVRGRGRAFRLGGDEFCVLLDGVTSGDDPSVAAAAAALTERGEGFTTSASLGLVVLPTDATDPTAALQLADERMYANKHAGRTSSRRQARDVLLQVISEREPALHDHTSDVARTAEAVGRELGLDAEALDVVMRAAELHDVGKVAIPDAILHKPGPLDDGEWELMHEHTVIGERIVSVAPALRPVAQLIRASHERWDGTGYPDALAGENIPLGARIVAVCDAFDAMVAERSYRPRRPADEALDELRRCAGVQFDPLVVEAFAAMRAPAPRPPVAA